MEAGLVCCPIVFPQRKRCQTGRRQGADEVLRGQVICQVTQQSSSKLDQTPSLQMADLMPTAHWTMRPLMRPPPQGCGLAHRPGPVTCPEHPNQPSERPCPWPPGSRGRGVSVSIGLVFLRGGPGSKHLALWPGSPWKRGSVSRRKGHACLRSPGVGAYSSQGGSPAGSLLACCLRLPGEAQFPGLLGVTVSVSDISGQHSLASLLHPEAHGLQEKRTGVSWGDWIWVVQGDGHRAGLQWGPDFRASPSAPHSIRSQTCPLRPLPL